MSQSDEGNSWEGIHDWLGTEDPTWSPKKVKELLRSLIDSKLIYTFDEAALYGVLLTKGVLNLGNNRHDDFLKNLAKASKTKAGLEAIEKYATSDSKIPPDISRNLPENTQYDDEGKIGTATSDDLKILVKDKNELSSDIIVPVEHILSTAEAIQSISVDEETMQFYVNYCINQLWKNAFRDEKNTVKLVEESGKSGNKFRDLVAGTFLNDYHSSQKLKNNQVGPSWG